MAFRPALPGAYGSMMNQFYGGGGLPYQAAPRYGYNPYQAAPRYGYNPYQAAPRYGYNPYQAAPRYGYNPYQAAPRRQPLMGSPIQAAVPYDSPVFGGGSQQPDRNLGAPNLKALPSNQTDYSKLNELLKRGYEARYNTNRGIQDSFFDRGARGDDNPGMMIQDLTTTTNAWKDFNAGRAARQNMNNYNSYMDPSFFGRGARGDDNPDYQTQDLPTTMNAWRSIYF